jgi:hypothetical protein
MKDPEQSLHKSVPDRLKHFAKDSPNVRLGALAIEVMPDILIGLGKVLTGAALLTAVFVGAGTATPYLLRLLRVL